LKAEFRGFVNRRVLFSELIKIFFLFYKYLLTLLNIS